MEMKLPLWRVVCYPDPHLYFAEALYILSWSWPLKEQALHQLSWPRSQEVRGQPICFLSYLSLKMPSPSCRNGAQVVMAKGDAGAPGIPGVQGPPGGHVVVLVVGEAIGGERQDWCLWAEFGTYNEWFKVPHARDWCANITVDCRGHQCKYVVLKMQQSEQSRLTKDQSA